MACHAAHRAEDVDALLDGLAPILAGGFAGAEGGRTAPVPVPVSSTATTPQAPVFIVGTDTDIGKTVVAAAVARALDAR